MEVKYPGKFVGETMRNTASRPIIGQRLDIWEFQPNPKYSEHGVCRTVHPRETIRRVLPLMGMIGVTRVGEITKLDRMGIPNFVSVRPCDKEPGISFYNGKGTTRLDAHAGALMEAVERYSGESFDGPIIEGSYNAVSKGRLAVKPAQIIVPGITDYNDDLEIEWAEGFDLVSKREILIPLNAVVCPYEPINHRLLFYPSSNGLASGNTMEEAICQGLCEIMERDAVGLGYARVKLLPAMMELWKKLGLAIPEKSLEPLSEAALIDLDSLPKRSRMLVQRIKKAGLEVYVRDFSRVSGVPTFECVIVDRHNTSHLAAFAGQGTHPDARIAISRAITEAAQSRVATIQGGREDLPNLFEGRGPFDFDSITANTKVISFCEVQTYQNRSINADIDLLLSKLSALGLDQVVVVNMTRPEIEIPVVRILVPNAETWPVFHLHVKRAALGPRVRAVLSNALGRGAKA